MQHNSIFEKTVGSKENTGRLGPEEGVYNNEQSFRPSKNLIKSIEINESKKHKERYAKSR